MTETTPEFTEPVEASESVLQHDGENDEAGIADVAEEANDERQF